MKLSAKLFSVICILIAASLYSCAKTTTTSNEEKENKALEAWVAKYAPEALKVEGQPVYYKVTETASDGAEAVEDGKWVRIEYNIRDLKEQNIIITRDEATAKRMNTYTPYTHYVPDYVYVSPTGLVKGLYYALAGMKLGEKRDAYIPSHLSFKSNSITNTSGYGGETLAANEMIILEGLKVVEIVDDNEDRELQMVEDYVDANTREDWKEIVNEDKSRLYIKYLSTSGSESDEVKDTETIYLYYKSMFVSDGTVFDTNMKEVRGELYKTELFPEGIRNISDTSVLMVSKKTENTPAKIIKSAFDELHYNDHAVIVMTSDLAYSKIGRAGHVTTLNNYTFYDYASWMNTGKSTDLSKIYPFTAIQPYSPVIFELKVNPKVEKE